MFVLNGNNAFSGRHEISKLYDGTHTVVLGVRCQNYMKIIK